MQTYRHAHRITPGQSKKIRNAGAHTTNGEQFHRNPQKALPSPETLISTQVHPLSAFNLLF